MHGKRPGPTWWHAWVPLLFLGGLLVLEHQAPLSPGGHKLVQLALTLLMYGVVVGWLRCNRGALVHEAYEREQKEGVEKTTQRASAMSDSEPGDAAELPGQNNRHSTDIQRRR
jgi:hypothetical protein